MSTENITTDLSHFYLLKISNIRKIYRIYLNYMLEQIEALKGLAITNNKALAWRCQFAKKNLYQFTPLE